jgi:hypothetical protein
MGCRDALYSLTKHDVKAVYDASNLSDEEKERYKDPKNLFDDHVWKYKDVAMPIIIETKAKDTQHLKPNYAYAVLEQSPGSL